MNYQGHTGSANMLVIRLTNVHYDANEKAIEDFFHDNYGYKILDQVRAMNPRTKTISTVYVMLASVQDRIFAVKNLNGSRICGRKVNVMPAHTGNYEINATHDGFVHDDDIAAISEEPSPANVNFTESEFPALGAKSTLRTKAAHPVSLGPAPTTAQRTQASPANPDTPEATGSRVLFINDIHPAATNDNVVAFLSAYQPEAIDRIQLGSNWMPSALVLMRTVQGRDLAAKELNGKKLKQQKVVVQPFNNVSQDILNRLSSDTIPPTIPSTHSRNPSDVPHVPTSTEPSSIAAILRSIRLNQATPRPDPQDLPFPHPTAPSHAPHWLWAATPSILHHRFTSTSSGPQPAAPDTGFREVIDMPRIPTFLPDDEQYPGYVLRLPPQDVDTDIAASGEWALCDGGDGDVRGCVVSEEEWSGFGGEGGVRVEARERG